MRQRAVRLLVGAIAAAAQHQQEHGEQAAANENAHDDADDDPHPIREAADETLVLDDCSAARRAVIRRAALLAAAAGIRERRAVAVVRRARRARWALERDARVHAVLAARRLRRVAEHQAVGALQRFVHAANVVVNARALVAMRLGVTVELVLRAHRLARRLRRR